MGKVESAPQGVGESKDESSYRNVPEVPTEGTLASLTAYLGESLQTTYKCSGNMRDFCVMLATIVVDIDAQVDGIVSGLVIDMKKEKELSEKTAGLSKMSIDKLNDKA